ncbi:MAG TPA: 23S rRNA (adenine(2503)-C(2))-methyltransferase RlmN [Candidatus Atribacteria bacterium]|nr:MAG: putative dual-specificity RNA methyltransferase RlmN [Atribacteria bacterium 34_128]HAJ32636.1 23S rRNA (adenine(2503)-C(2))-methyltransferase RlmN [Candidatus Atribacteria bacterium]
MIIQKKDIKNFTLNELQEEVKNLGVEKYRAAQLFDLLYKKGIEDFREMLSLPASFRDLLQENYYISKIELAKLLKSKDQTEKYLFKLEDENLIESVLIFSNKRVTECISSQIGCKYNCLFCESGKKGFSRNLTVSEILNQVLFVKKKMKSNPNNIVFMGIGEPLDNYDNVVKAICVLNSKDTFDIGARKITISTCGIIPAIKRLQKRNWQIELSVSLHAPENKLRSYLMPVNNLYPLPDLIEVCRNYTDKTNRQITFEYILIKGVNDSVNYADKLAKLIGGFNSKVNLITFNPAPDSLLPPAAPQVKSFKNELIAKGIPTTIRISKGDDISAACGQLKSLHLK